MNSFAHSFHSAGTIDGCERVTNSLLLIRRICVCMYVGGGCEYGRSVSVNNRVNLYMYMWNVSLRVGKVRAATLKR